MIYLKTKKKFKDIEDLVEYGYKIPNAYGFKPTFKNKECSIFECHQNAYRSFDGLLEICQTYFPETTDKDLAKLIFKLHKKIGLIPSYCGTIKKIVFEKHIPSKTIDINNNLYLCEYTKKGDGTHSWNMIVKLEKS